jgi:hypothetical protein
MSFPCALVWGILGTHVNLWIHHHCKTQQTSLSKTLSPSQLVVMKRIFWYRAKISIGSLLVSGLVTLMLMFWVKNNSKNNVDKKQNFQNFQNFQHFKNCTWLAFWLFLYMLFYLLFPKSNYMMDHLQDLKQTKAWFDIYKCMQRHFVWGFVWGIILYYLFVFIKNILFRTHFFLHKKDRK